MKFEWQSLAAAGIVILTMAIFLVRMLRPRPKDGCGHGCGCGKKTEAFKAPSHD
jgi:hypothetical protein